MQLRDVRVDFDIMPLPSLRAKILKEYEGEQEVAAHARFTMPDGRRFSPTTRFWTSWCSLYGQSRSIFDMMSPTEAFERMQLHKPEPVRIAYTQKLTEDMDGSQLSGELLACTNPQKPLLDIRDAEALIKVHEGRRAHYADGQVAAFFSCPFPAQYRVGQDKYTDGFLLHMPIDGFGLPYAYLAFENDEHWRVVAAAPQFKSQFQLGKDQEHVAVMLDRVLQTFSAEEGYHMLRSRLEQGLDAWASFEEATSLYKVMREELRSATAQRKYEILTAFDKKCGDPLAFYGLTSRQELSSRKARMLPVHASAYELVVYAAELVWHLQLGLARADRVYKWMGQTIAGEYDLEGSKARCRRWADFFKNRQPI